MRYHAFIFTLWLLAFAARAWGAEVEPPRPYAPITAMELKHAERPGEYILVLSGNIEDRCFRMKSVEVDYYPDLIEVFPYMEMSETDETRCGAIRVPFHFAQPLHVEPGSELVVYVHTKTGPPLVDRFYFGE